MCCIRLVGMTAWLPSFCNDTASDTKGTFVTSVIHIVSHLVSRDLGISLCYPKWLKICNNKHKRSDVEFTGIIVDKTVTVHDTGAVCTISYSTVFTVITFY